MIHMPEYSLYEAEDLFLKPIGIPDDFGFPVREDLIYQPQFHFADMKWGFSDWMFLEYLSNPQRAAELFAQKWLLEKLPEISKKKICIGCIREEMEEMLKKTGTGPEVSLPRSA